MRLGGQAHRFPFQRIRVAVTGAGKVGLPHVSGRSEPLVSRQRMPRTGQERR